MKFVILRGKVRNVRDQWRRAWFVRVVARNGRTLCTSEPYTRHTSAWRFIRALRYGAAAAKIVEPK